MPCGAFTWTDSDGYWIHPDHGNRYTLDDFDDVELGDDGREVAGTPVPTEIAERITDDDPFSDDNFGPWCWMNGDEVSATIVSAESSTNWI